MNLIYKHSNNITGKSYIGRTSTTLQRRLNDHIIRSNNGSLREFHVSIRKYGITNFTSTILEDNLSNHDAHIREKYWIKYYDSYKSGYNMNDGGANGMQTAASKMKFRKTMTTIQSSGLTIAQESYIKRNNTLAKTDPLFLKNIGRKGSLTQKLNGKHKGHNNSNFNKDKVAIVSQLGDVTYILYHDLSKLDKTKYPVRAMIWSLRNNKPMYMSNPPRNSTAYNKYIGYSVCYHDKLYCDINTVIHNISPKIKKHANYEYELYNATSNTKIIIKSNQLRKYCIEHSLNINQIQYSHRNDGKPIKDGKCKGWYCIKQIKLT